jgi:ribonucleoside-diphosphate reductase alpha chain
MSTFDEAKKKSLEFFNGDELAADTFVKKYALKQMVDKKWKYEELTPSDMHARLAREFYRMESKYSNPMSESEIFDLFKDFKYIVPQGSPMSVIGNPYQVSSISNCVVLPKIWDSYGGICFADQQILQLSKRRCGVGLDISPIRPKGLPTKNSSLTTDGIASYMERYSNSIREVGQSGRRGAMMLTINVHHPEVLTFATIKKDLTKVTGANISIFLTDEFLKAVEKGEKYEQRWPVDAKKPKFSNMVDAREVWNKIIETAHMTAEPGLMFIDSIIKDHPASAYADEGFTPHSSNPCSEISMNADTCRLMAINMSSFVENPFTKEAKFDFDKWSEVVYKAQRLMDDMVDLEIEYMGKIIAKIKSDPEPEHIKAIELRTWEEFLENAGKGRRTGLGVTAIGDAFAYLNVKYGSEESIELMDKIFKAKKLAEYRSSIDLAEQRGNFPMYSYAKEKDNAFIKQLIKDAPEFDSLLKKHGRRNVCISTIAPTGSVSILTQTTSGIEPVFALSYTRKKKITTNDDAKADYVDQLGDKFQIFTVYHHGLEKWMKITGETDIKKSPYYGSTSYDMNYQQRVKLQAAAQKHIDHAISSTVNLPSDATIEDVSKIYTEAWNSGLKGITVYRDGCRDGILVSGEAKDEKDKKDQEEKSGDHKAIIRPSKIPCDVFNIVAEGVRWTVLVGLVDGQPYEIFCGKPKKVELGKTEKGYIEKEAKGVYSLHIGEDTILKDISDIFTDTQGSITRLTSTLLRHGVDLQFIVQQLEKSDGSIVSFNKAVSRVLKKYIKDGVKEKGAKCQECGAESLVRQEGCVTCKNCGWSKC